MKQESVLMVLNRKFSLASTLGHVLSFEKDVPLPVPAIMVRQCAAIGAVRVDGDDVFKAPEEAKSAAPLDPGERAEDIRAAFEILVEQNTRDDFTAAGQPTVNAVAREVGYKVDRVEIMRAWEQRAEDLVNADHGAT